MANSDATYVPILPSFDKFFSEVDKGARKGGKQAGDAFSSAMGASVAKSQKAVDKATGQYERARDRATTAAEKTRVAELKLAEVQEKGTASASQIAKASNDVEKARRDQARAEGDATKASNNLETAQGELAKANQESSDSMEAAAGSSRDFGKAMDVAAGAAVGMAAAAAGALITLGNDFDAAFRSIRVGTGASGEAFEGLKDSALAVADTIPAMDGGMGQISETLADLNTRLGVTGKPLETMTSQFVELANMGIEADINSVSKAFSGFGVEAENAPAALDELFQVSQATGLTVTELADSVSKAGPALRGFGFSLGDSAALMGQMDKAGIDADGTMQRMTRAMSAFAEQGRDAPTALRETVTEIDGLITSGNDAAAMNLASDLFGTRGAAQFVDAVKSGTLSVEDFMAATGATDDSILGVAGETRSFSESFQLLKQRSANALQPLASELVDKAVPAIESAADALSGLIDWVRENKTLVSTLAVTVAGMTAGFVAWRGALMAITVAQKAWNVINLLSTKGVKGLNAAMRANVIGLVVTAIAGLVAGLTWFFTQTETGKAVWQGFMDVLSSAWNWLSTVFTPVFSWIASAATGAWDLIKSGWQLLVDAFSVYWTNVLQPVFNALAATANWLWANVLQPVFGFIGSAWSLLVNGIVFYWQNVLQPAWNALQLAAQWMWTNVLMPVFGFIQSRWEVLAGAIVFAWQNIIQPAWNALQTALQFLWNNVVSPIFGFIQDRWNTMAEGIRWVRDNIIQPVFDAFQGGLDTLKGWFDTTVDAIGRTWDRVRELVAKPIRFVVETVFNNGIMKAWNAVVGFIGMEDKKLQPVDLGGLGAYASGGVLPGYTPGRDPYTFVEPNSGLSIGLSGGEAIMRPEWTRAVGGPSAVAAMNQSARRGSFVKKYANDDERNPYNKGIDAAFAGGGVIGSITGLVNRYFPGMSITSTQRNTNDYHGQGKAVDFSNGSDTTPQMQAAARFFHDNYGPALLELIHWPLNGWQNIKHGAPLMYPPGTNAGHRNHVHVAAAGPLPEPGQPIEPVPSGGGGGGGFFDMVASLVKPAWDKIMDAIPDFEGIGMAAEVPGAFLKTAGGMMWDFVKEKASSIGAFFGDPGAGVEQWRGLVEKILSDKGFSVSLADTVLRRMNQESGGNPRAINNWDSNALAGTPSKGLMQVIDPTFAANKDPGHNNIWDPEANIRASMNYAVGRYGSLPAAYNKAGGYALGGVLPDFGKMTLHDEGGYLDPNTIGINKTRKPEPVFTNEQWRTIADSIWTSAQARQWEEMVDQMTEAAEVFANGAHQIGAQFESDFAAWQSGTHIQVSEDQRLMTPNEMGSQVSWWAGSEIAEEVGGMFGLSSQMVGDLLGAGGFTDPGFDESALVKLDTQDVTAEQVNVSAADVTAEPLPETGKGDGEPYLVIENVTVEGNATEEDGARFVRGAMEEARTRGRMARVN